MFIAPHLGNMFKHRLDGAMRIMMIGALLACVGCAALTGKGQRDDATITAAVRAKLATDENLSSGAQIEVATTDGNVHLSGIVASEIERLRAAEVARKIEGVFKVTNRLQVNEVSARRQSQR